MGFPGAFPGLGPTPGASALDGPPPSPTAMGGPPDAAGGGSFSTRGLAGSLPTGQMPPEVLTGISQSAQAVGQMLDAWAQVTPDQGAQLGLIKDLIQQYLAGLMQNGAGPVAPTAPGGAFPGGGMDRGIASAGTM